MNEDLNPYEAPGETLAVPGAPSTAATRFTRGEKLLTRLVWGYPLLFSSSPYATWLIGWLELGYAPRVSLDDPKSISLAVDLAYNCTMALLIGFPAALLGGLFYLGMRCKRAGGFTRLAGFVVLWCSVVGLARLDPLRVGEWFMD